VSSKTVIQRVRPEPASGGIKQLAKASATYGLGSVLVRALTFLLLPVYTRHLAPADYGIIAVAVTIASILGAIMPIGLHGAVARFYYQVETDAERRRVNGTLWLAVAASALVMSLLLDLIGAPVFRVLVPNVPFHPYLRLAIWTACLTSLGLVPLAMLQVQERARLYVVLSTGSAAATLALVAYLVVFRGWGARGYLIGGLCGAALAAVAYVVVALRIITPGIDLAHLRAALIYSVPLVPHAIASWVLELSDRAVLARFVPLSDVGVYSLGYQLGAAVGLLTAAFTSAWVPVLFRGLAKNDPAVDRELSRLGTYFVVGLVFCCLGSALLAEPVLGYVLAPAYHDAYRVTLWIVGAYVLGGLYILPIGLLFWQKTTWLIPLITVTAGSVNVALNLLFVPRFGYMTAAWSTLVSNAVMLLMAWQLARRRYAFPYEYRRMGLTLASALGLFIIGIACARALPAASLVFRIGAWLVFPAGLLVLGVMGRSEFGALWRWLNSRDPIDV
jgi:O-antigen/teichoic acid export membrane protein